MTELTELNTALDNAQDELKKAQDDLSKLESERDNLEPTDLFSHDQYDDMLDEIYGDAEVAGMTFSTSRALKELDPTAYRCGYNDWADGEDITNTEEYKELDGQVDDAQCDIEYWEEKIEELEEEIQEKLEELEDME